MGNATKSDRKIPPRTQSLLYEYDERIAIQQEGSNLPIDVVRRQLVDEAKGEEAKEAQ